MCSKFLYSRAEYKNLMLQKIFERNQATHITQGKKRIILNTIHRTKNYIHRKKNLAVISAGELRLRTHHLFFFSFFQLHHFLLYYYERLFLFFYVLYHSDLYLCNFLGIVGTSLQNFHFLVHIWRVHPLCSSGIFVGFSKSSKQGT